MISAQTLRVCREGKPVPTFPDHALVSDKAASAEAAATTVSGPAKAAVPTANKTAAPEINLGRLRRILAAQITQQCVEALVIALDGCAWSMQLQDSR
jgi:hypothetical protein